MEKQIHIKKQIYIETIARSEEFKETELLTKEEVKTAIEAVIAQIRCNMKYFGSRFPSPAAKGGTYEIIENIEWTTGFWTGMLWLAYEYTKEPEFRELAEQNIQSFDQRVRDKVELDHHDLGFLYSLSCVAGYKLTGSEIAKKAGLLAADKLMERYQEKGGFLQAWGVLGKKEDYRLIIDCMLNVPLLYWASQITGDKRYETVAETHFKTSCQYVIREDASAFHTYYFDPEDGKPVRGATRQGYDDNSSWARGQAWGIYGIPLNYRYLKEHTLFPIYKGMVNYYLNRLPEDCVCFWDLIFSDGSGQSRDSSAAAAAVCGMLEMNQYLPETDPDKETYHFALHRILRSLIHDYTAKEIRPGSPVLLHGVYSWHSLKGVDEGNIWGDYFYLEALIRLERDWQIYW